MAKDKNKFQLNKGGERNFDISKKGKRTFDLSKDDDDIAGVTNAAEPDGANLIEQSEEGAKSRAWMWIVVVIALLIGVAIWWFMTNQSDENAQPAQEKTEQEEAAKTEENADDAKGETPESIVSEPSEETRDMTPAAEASVAEAPAANTQQATVQKPAQTQITDQTQTRTPAQTQTQAPAVSRPQTQSATATTANADVETEALNVIRGVYGDGNERRQALGSRYAEIQARVNQMKRDGLF